MLMFNEYLVHSIILLVLSASIIPYIVGNTVPLRSENTEFGDAVRRCSFETLLHCHTFGAV